MTRNTNTQNTKQALLPHLIVVTLHKSGTHLLLRLVEELGFHRRYFDQHDIESAHSENPEAFLSRLSRNGAYFLHELPISKFPRPVLEYWREHQVPRIIYQYRDPRAVLLSQVNYLRRQHKNGQFSNTSSHLLYADILQAQPSEEDALSVALDCMGDYIRSSYLDSVWMLHHPQVQCVRFESLVGARGGGCDQTQSEQVGDVATYLDVSVDPIRIASRLYDPQQPTFFRGHSSRWREVYSDVQMETFERRFGTLLDIYGYPRLCSLRNEGQG